MVARCTNPEHAAWKNYGGRGVTLCERWRVFENFLADMGECPSGLTLDRKDNDGGYEPANCRWATRSQQNRTSRCALNLKRDRKLTDAQVFDIRANSLLCRVTKAELARRFGISPQHVSRIVRGQRRS
jgi:hypothetical protein